MVSGICFCKMRVLRSIRSILKEVVYDSVYDFNIETYVDGMLDDFFSETSTEIAKSQCSS